MPRKRRDNIAETASKTPETAAQTGAGETYEDLLGRTIDRLKIAVFDPDTPPRDLAALTRRLMEFEKELLRLREETGDGPADLTEAEDADFDPEEDI